jgi:hypothetical protein
LLLSGTPPPRHRARHQAVGGVARGVECAVQFFRRYMARKRRGELPCYVGAMCVWVGVGGLGNDATVTMLCCFFKVEVK